MGNVDDQSTNLERGFPTPHIEDWG
jgi:hypothetical protein